MPRPSKWNGLVSAVALLAIPVGALFLIDEAQFPGWEALLPVLATAAIIWFGSGTLVDRRLLGTRPIVYIGLISFPLYLWHWVILSFIRIENPAPPGVILAAALAASTALAAATYHFIEKPLKRANLRVVSTVALISMAAVFAFALAAHQFGWSGVQLTDTQKALSNAYDPRPAYRFQDCFLDSAAQTSADFAAKCEVTPKPGEGTLLLWGDSLTAQLYPGLEALGDGLGYALDQRTASSCPPSTTDEYADRGNCNEINSATRDWIVGIARAR